MRYERSLFPTGLLASMAFLLPLGAGAAEVLSPPSWTGQWDFTVTYRNGQTGEVEQVDHVANDICPGEPLGLALFAKAPSCQTTVTGGEVSLRCGGDLSVGTCGLRTSLQLDLLQQGAAIDGSGEWSAAILGDCPLADLGLGQTIQIAAVRRSTVPSAGCTQPSSLAQKFVTTAEAIDLSDNPFADLRVDEIEIDRDEFEVEGAFTLANNSNGIDPRAEAVRLQVGAYSTTIPAGSFRLKPARGRSPAEFTFEGSAGGARLRVQMVRRADKRFDFSARGDHARLGRTSGPLPVVVAIGDDTGTIAARLCHGDDDHDRCDDDDDRGGHGRRERE